MNLKEKDEITKIYESYGYETKVINSDLVVYSFTKARYYGADLVMFSDTLEINNACKELQQTYSKIGYATNIKYIDSVYEAEIDLFNSFFVKDLSISRIKKKYKDFCNLISNSNYGVYSYINSIIEIDDDSDIDVNIFDFIDLKLKSSFPELIIIEAMAGFGKTCSAFEIMKEIVENGNNRIPILTELSRNRGIKKFRYILLDEIDNEFPHLGSDIVIREIKNGRIPLIIDGFDELIEKTSDPDGNRNFEEAETMLDTIGAILNGKSKIILTSRKTALFSGNEFDRWKEKFNHSFKVTRINIKEPRIKDWIGLEKYLILKNSSFPFKFIANPVLLTFIKNFESEKFGEFICNPGVLVDFYFEIMLEREKTRQGLLMTPYDQLAVFKNVTKTLIELDSSSEEKSFFKEIIFDTNKHLLEVTRKLYSGDQDKHNIETLVDTLSNHAILNKKGRDKNNIGFINDFIFGILIGLNLIEDENNEIETISSFMIELAVTAFRVQIDENKSKLWHRLNSVYNDLPIDSQFFIDINLLSKTTKKYENICINDYSLYNINFSFFELHSVIFVNCSFYHCTLDIDKYAQLSFISCCFISSFDASGRKIKNSDQFQIINCKDTNSDFLESDLIYNTGHELLSSKDLQILNYIYENDLKGYILINKIYSHNKDLTSKNISEGINKLTEIKFVKIFHESVYLNINKIEEIKSILKII